MLIFIKRPAILVLGIKIVKNQISDTNLSSILKCRQESDRILVV